MIWKNLPKKQSAIFGTSLIVENKATIAWLKDAIHKIERLL